MFDHISIGITDFKKSLAFYTAIMDALGHDCTFANEEHGYAMFGQKPDAFFIGLPLDQSKPAAPCNGSHICFSADSRQKVERFYKTALENGGNDSGAPGYRREYQEDYYAAFVFDPDGHKIEAVAYVREE